MHAVKNVLVIGGGFSGMAAAIQLAKAGFAVDLLESDPHWRPIGAGLTVSGPTLRALQTLGVYERFKQEGFISTGIEIRAMNGQPLSVLETPTITGQDGDVGGGAGIMRPALARMLADATLAAGVRVRLGQSFTALSQTAAHVSVTFSNGDVGEYDLVVGADGVHSTLRAQLFPEVTPPEYIGQGVWRAVLPRPAAVQQPIMWLGPHIKVGVNPVSNTHMYLFITEDRVEKQHIPEDTFATVCEGLLRPFTDPLLQALVPHLRAPEAAIDYRALANLLVPLPWNRGRVVMIGDAVAATTPHLASGAGIGIESGIVLAEELARHADLGAALDAFHARRWARCRLVIHNSERLCRIEIEGGDKAEHARIMRESLLALAQPI